MENLPAALAIGLGAFAPAIGIGLIGMRAMEAIVHSTNVAVREIR